MMTLCVPTLNRPEFLARLLRYYATTRYRHWIFIGDSSECQHAERNQQTVASFDGVLKVVYRHYPGLSSCACVEQLNREVTTPYCAFMADDDFVTPSGLDRCLAFLERHSDYVAAHGRAILFQIEGGGAHGAIGNVGPYPQAVVRSETGAARLREFFTSSLYTLLFSVHRTEAWQAMFRGVSSLPGDRSQNIFKDELIPVSVSVIRGKVQELDGLYLARQAHEGIYRHPDIYDWITDPAWLPSYEVFRDRLGEELCRQDGLDAAEARRVVKDVCWAFLAHGMMSSWQAASRQPVHAERRLHGLRRVARQIPGLRPIWRRVRALIERRRTAWSLPALLLPGSPYHQDFLPIYAAVTRPPVPFSVDRLVAGEAAAVEAGNAAVGAG